MKTLPETNIPHHGHTLALIERTPKLGLFRSTWKQDTTPGFIVAKIRTRPAATRTLPNGQVVTYEAGEFLPSEAEYGSQAWFFRCLDAARMKFNLLGGAQTPRLTASPLS